YREKAIKRAIENCQKLGVPFEVVSFKKEYKITNDKLMPIIMNNPKLGGTCAFCGTLRRNIMNRYAKNFHAQKLATGHNLDDEVQSFVMNIFNNDFERMKRMSASGGVVDYKGFVKRIKPLYETPEKEIIAYCAIKGIKHYSEECCPYSWTAKRNEYREMLNNFERRFPGTEYSILRFYENIHPLIRPSEIEKPKLSQKLHECEKCHEPTEREMCKACEMIEKIKNEEIKLENEKIKPSKKQGSKKVFTARKQYNKKLTCLTTKNSGR
ncbi:MAG: TIGR00269 family protein, partial [Candidatus Diapherotrites archaeon]|nr:TIGR00269 family protein [Candidatus Diapherotrites archaeon]